MVRTGSSDFSIISQPNSSVAGGSSTSISIKFTPSGRGTKSATFSIANTDYNEDPYVFTVNGVGLSPEIVVIGNSNAITSGSTSTSTSNLTDFSYVNISGGSKTANFEIKNSGNTGLLLTGSPLVGISGTHASDFSVTQQPSSTVSSSSIFKIMFNPNAEGVRTATVTIENNDLDEDPYTFAIKGTGVTPQISISGVSIGGTSNFGSIATSSSFGVTKNYTIRNVGGPSTSLRLNGSPRIKISGTSASDFQVTNTPSSTLSSGSSSQLSIRFKPTTPGTKTASVTIENNDLDDDPLEFDLVGIALEAEMSIEGNGNFIVNGSTTISTNRHTDFGELDAYSSSTVSKTFTIKNTGNTSLNLQALYSSYIRFSGSGSSSFKVASNPSSTVSSNGSTTFTIKYDPHPSYTGTQETTVSIESNDPDDSPYSFKIKAFTLTREIDIKGNGNSISDGSYITSTNNNTDFGNVDVSSGSVTKTFYIHNTGTADLTLSSPYVAIGSNRASEFSITQPTSTTIAASSSVAFSVTCNPTSLGTLNSILYIYSNDYNESTYNFNIVAKGTEPEIDLIGNSVSIPDGNTNYSTSDFTDFGENAVNSAALEKTFFIKNTGTGSLNLSGTGGSYVQISGANSTGFSVKTQPSSANISANGSKSFVISYNSSTATSNTAVITINSNDDDESEYTFNIKASASYYIKNNGPTTATKNEFSITSSSNSGYALQDANDKVIIEAENGSFQETTSNIPTSTNVTSCWGRSWKLNITDDAINTGGLIDLSFNLGSSPNSDYSYYLLERNGTTGAFTVINNLNYKISGNQLVFTIDLDELTSGNYYTLGRSDIGAGFCLDFDGTDDYVSTNIDVQPSAMATTTLETWLYPTRVNYSSHQAIFSNDDGGWDRFLMIKSGTNKFGVSNGSGWFTPNYNITANKWIHVALVYSSNNIELYIDGIKYEYGSAPTAQSSNNKLYFGENSRGNFRFKGKMDEVRIWSDIRTQAEIRTSMHRNLVGNESNLQAYYKFDQVSETYLPDVSQNDNQGKLVNFTLTGTSSNWVESTVLLVEQEIQEISYVDVNATGSNNGSSWANAFTNLQDALDWVMSTTGIVEEIRIAEGTYNPTQSPDDVSTNDRDWAFHLANKDVIIKGGYDPATGLQDGDATILSGDIGTINTISDNCYHVFIMDGLTSSTKLESVTISHGNANGLLSDKIVYNSNDYIKGYAGGLFLISAGIIIDKVTISNNSAIFIGAMFILNNSPTINNSVFYNNIGTSGAAALWLASTNVDASLTNILFLENSAPIYGALGLGANCNATLTNCSFIKNTAQTDEAAIYTATNSNITLKNSLFYGNNSNTGNNIEINGTLNTASSNNASDITSGNPLASGTGFVNLSSTASSLLFSDYSDFIGTDGFWMTDDDGLILKYTSAIARKANKSSAPIVDITGATRSVTSSIGAYEYQGAVAQETIYVDVNANGENNGSTWANALTNLQEALDLVMSTNGIVDEILIAEGTYYPSHSPDDLSSNNRDWAFHLANKDVIIKGGYDPATGIQDGDATILSGDIGTINTISDNCYHVFIMEGLTSETKLESVTISHGNANGSTTGKIVYNSKDYIQGYVGALYLISAGITINNVIISNNSAISVGGLYSLNNSPTITNSIFYKNEVSISVGGIYLGGNNVDAHLTNVLFLENTGGDFIGGLGLASGCQATLANCSFIKNNAQVNYANILTETNSNITLINNLFYANSGSGTHISIGGILNSASANNASDITSGNPLASGSGFVDLSSVSSSALFQNYSNFIGTDGVWLTDDDGLKISRTSDAYGAGTSSGAPSSDITGKTWDDAPSIGAYEGDKCSGTYSNIYVDANATGLNNGLSWTDAFNDLQPALDLAMCATVTNVLIAEGTYHPTESPDEVSTNNRDWAFHLANSDVIIKGGYDPATGLQDGDATVLSGDFDDDDVITGTGSTLSFSNNTENAYHVFITSSLTSDAILDKITIRGGYANGSSSIGFNSETFAQNDGGGLFNISSSPTANNVILTENSASHWGGGLYNDESNPALSNVTVNKNLAYFGGGMANINTSVAELLNSSITGNKANWGGGGMYNRSASNAVLSNVIISNNRASYDGGGIYNQTSAPKIFNVVFSSNRANYGGAMYNNGVSVPIITNCTFYSNLGIGKALRNHSNSNAIVSNSILWDNGGEMANYYSTPTFKNCIIKSSGGSASWNTGLGTDNGGNLDTDPLFSDEANGDFTLLAGSPAINNGSNSAWVATGLSLDANNEARPQGIIVDMGAFERTFTSLINGGLITDDLNELTITSTENSGFALQNVGDQICFDVVGDFMETTNDLPSSANAASRYNRTWLISYADANSNGGLLDLEFDLSAAPNSDYSYYLLTRAGTSGDFTVVNNLNYRIVGNEVIFSLDLGELSSGNFYTLGRSDVGAGYCLDFDGSGDYVDLSHLKTDLAGSDLTFEAWVFGDNTTTHDAIFSINTSSGGNRLLLFNNELYDGSSSPVYSYNLSNTINDNKWHHVAIALESDNSITLYVDGNLVTSHTNTGNLTVVTNTDKIQLGMEWDGGSKTDYLKGKMDEVRIWTDIRTKDEIKKNMYKTLVGNETDLLAYYKFDQTTESYLPDVSQNDNQGQLVGFGLSGTSSNWVESNASIIDKASAPQLAGPGNCLAFDGADDYVDLSALSSDLAGEDLTFEAWVNNSTLSTAKEAIFCINTSTGGNQILLFNNHLWEQNATSGNQQYNISNITDGKWHHVALVLESGVSYRLYIDGYLKKEYVSSGNVTVVSSNDKISLGMDYDNSSKTDYWEGKIDDVRIWTSLRTQTEIQDNMYASLEGDETDLLAYYDFDELSGSTLYDEVGSNNGSLNNFSGTYWVSAADREPFKTIRSGSHTSSTTWKGGTAPTASSSELAVFHDLTLSSTATNTYSRLQVNSGKTITSNADINITGDVIVNGTATGVNKITLNGSTKQQLGGSGTVGALEIDNSNDVSLEGDLTIGGTLTLTSGDIEVNGHALTLSGTTTNGSSASYLKINGTGGVKMNVGSTPVLFPIGRNPYMPVIIDDGGNADFTVGVYDGIYANPVTGSSSGTIAGHHVTSTWTITNNGSSVNNASVTLIWEDAQVSDAVVNTGTSGIGYWESGSSQTDWSGSSIGTPSNGTVSGTKQLTRTGLTLTGGTTYFLGVGGSGSPLPVEFTYFNAKWHSEVETAILNWQTALEENNSHFEIERSFDGVSFERIGTVAGQGSTMQTTDYEFVDDGIESEIQNLKSNGNELMIVYYRLKQVDYDGKYEFSETRSLNCEQEILNSFTLWPNPNNGGELYLSEIGNYQVFNTQGILLKSYIQVQKMDISDLAKGTYIIQDEMGAHQVLIRQ